MILPPRGSHKVLDRGAGEGVDTASGVISVWKLFLDLHEGDWSRITRGGEHGSRVAATAER
jgi:hypothetical protein